ncbi:hypothetical protein D3C71_1847190 [compost metagenome]
MSARRNSLPPKPPPTNGDIRWILSFAMPSVVARSDTVQSIIWFDVQIESRSPFQAAVVACGSITA